MILFNSKKLSEAISRVAYATAKKNSQFDHLKNICLKLVKKDDITIKTEIVATDTYRLAICSIEYILSQDDNNISPDELNNESLILIPKNNVPNVIKLFKKVKGNIVLNRKGDNIYFDSNFVGYFGKYNDYEPLLKWKDYNHCQIIVEKNEILKALKNLYRFHKDHNKALPIHYKKEREYWVIFTIFPEANKICAQYVGDIGIEEEIKTIEISTTNGEDFKTKKIVINLRFLKDAIENAKSDKIMIKMGDKEDVVVITELEKNSDIELEYMSLICPVRYYI